MKLFSNRFLIDHPLLWAILVFVFVEITYLVIDYAKYLEKINENLFKYFLVLFIKFAIFVLLVFMYKKFFNRVS
jgi:hypothetical protein